MERGGETGKPELFEGEMTSVLNESGTKAVDLKREIKIDETARLQAMVGMKNVDGRGKNLALGQTFGLLDFSNDEGQRLTVALEMRPKPVFGHGVPGFQIYVREMDVRMEEGYAELKYEVIQSVEGQELLLETENAEVRAVHPDGRLVDLPEPEVYAPEIGSKARAAHPDMRTTLHRLGHRSWRTLRWTFPTEHANDMTQVETVTGSRVWGVGADTSPTLFEVRNDAQGRLHSARLLMVPVESEEDVAESVKPSIKSIEFNPVYALNEGALAFRSKTSFQAGESLRSYLVRADGRSEENSSEHTLSGYPTTTEMSTSGFWSFHEECAADAVVNAGQQFRGKLKGNVLEAPYNERVRVFSITNLTGGVVHGELEVMKPEPDLKLAVSGTYVQAHSAVISGGDGIMLFLTADVPPGFRLSATADAPEGVNGDVQISMKRKSPFDDGTAIWRWRDALDDKALQEAVTQWGRFKGDTPLKIEPGRPAEVFAVTNASGKVFRGMLELMAPEADGQ